MKSPASSFPLRAVPRARPDRESSDVPPSSDRDDRLPTLSEIYEQVVASEEARQDIEGQGQETTESEAPSEPEGELADGELRVLLDAWGRYGGVIPVDDDAAHDRRLIRMFRQYAHGHYEAALATAERILAEKRSVRDAILCARSCRQRVELSQIQALGGPNVTLYIATAGPMLRALEQDDRTSLLVTLIRRRLPLHEILDFHGAERFEALQTILSLVGQGLISAH